MRFRLLKKEISPPYQPRVKGNEADVSLFDRQFTDEPVVDSVVADSHLSKAEADGFNGFTFDNRKVKKKIKVRDYA